MTQRLSIVRSMLAICLMSLSCAHLPRASQQDTTSRVVSAIHAGCYRCLLHARDLLQQSSARPSEEGELLLFQVHALLALRQRELGISSDASLAQARRMAESLPRSLAPVRVVRIVESVPVDDAAVPTEERQRFFRANSDVRGGLDETRLWLSKATYMPAFREYLWLSLDCSYPRIGRTSQDRSLIGADDPRSSAVPARDVPLLTYRRAICGAMDRDALARLREGFPDYTEAEFFQAKALLRVPQGDAIRRAAELLDRVKGPLASSSSVHYLDGLARQTSGDCNNALSRFDAALLLVPQHERAQLGRVICFSYLGNADAAISAADELITSAAPNVGDAYYWRAWNLHRRHEPGAALHDIERATRLLANEAVFVLHGAVLYDLGRLDDAERELNAARRFDQGGRNCSVMWYLGLVGAAREAWTMSGESFANATSCYMRSMAEIEALLTALTTAKTQDPFQEAQATALESTLVEERRQVSAAAFNAALQFIRAGDRARAATYLDTAALDPSRNASIEQLRLLLKEL